MSKNKILFIEICNFIDFPNGGYLSFAKQMLSAFGGQLALVGLVTEEDKNTPVGVWVKKEINTISYDFFAVRRSNKIHKKSIIPERLRTYFAVRKYRKEIFKIGVENIFIQTPEVLFAINKIKLINLCTRIPGLENPLSISRYWYGKYFAKIFETIHFNFLKKSQIILATGDDYALKDYIQRSRGVLDSTKIIKFPSRVNTNIFKLIDKEKLRNNLGWDLSKNYIVTSGRLSQLKGWQFLLDCLIEFKKIEPNSHFVFIGDGEDKEKIFDYIKRKELINDVTLTGRVNHNKLSNYLNASDLYVMGSYVEGWSTSLVEAIACAKPVACTNFSSAKELVNDGYNGYVIENRKQDEFVNAMINSLNLPFKNLLKRSEEMKKYSTDLLKEDITKYWRLK